MIETEKNVLEDIEAEWRRMIQSRESDFKSSEDEYLKVKVQKNSILKFLLHAYFVWCSNLCEIAQIGRK